MLQSTQEKNGQFLRFIRLLYKLVIKWNVSTRQIQGNLSEWLRRKIRNLLGFARAGSNPAVVDIF